MYKDVLIKPILTKQFVNQTVNAGQNVTFTCETQIDALPVFLFYKLNASILQEYTSMLQQKRIQSVDLLDKYAHALQDQQNIFNDFASVDPRVVLQRREHTGDPNKDPLSDLETVQLQILNTISSDSAYYLCIVANSVKSFRVTYSYLTVKDAKTLTSNMSSPAMDLKSLESYVERNKYLIFATSCFILVLVLIVAVSFCYCCLQCMRTKRMKEKFKYTMKAKKDHLTSSKMNSLLEKTMGTMRNNFVYSSMIPAYNQTISSSDSGTPSTLNSTLASENCLNNDAHYMPSIDLKDEFADKINLKLMHSDEAGWEFQKEK